MIAHNALDWSLKLVVSWQAIVIAIVLIALTIYLSVVIPAKRASKVSPIEAIRGNNEIKIKAKKLRTPKFIAKIFGIEGEMALKNLKRSRKKYRTTVISLMISIVLFISVSGFVGYMYGGFDAMYESVDYDYAITIFNEKESTTKEKLEAEEKIIKQIENSKNIDKLSIVKQVSGSAYIKEDKLDSKMKKAIEEKKYVANCFPKDENGYNVSTIVISLNDEQMKEYMKTLGINDLKDNQAILINYTNLLKTAQIEGNITTYKENDTLELHLHTYSEKESDSKTYKHQFEIAKVTKEMPYGVENGSYPKLILITKENTLNKLNGDNHISMMFTAKNDEEMKEKLAQLEKENSNLSMMNIQNVKEEMQIQRNLKLIINIFLYGFIALISAIGIANIFNTISTNINLRRREFAMLKSIGMTDKGFKKMLDLECFFYGTKALLYGLPIGIGICYLLNRGFGNMLEFVFTLPWSSIIISIIAVYLVVFITMLYSSAKIKKENIIDVLRDENI